MGDHDRPLDDRGLRDAPIMADLLKKLGYKMDKIVSSTANRAKTTAGYFAKANHLELNLEKHLYHGDPDDYLDVIHEQGEEVKALAMFGHNPGITYFANIIKQGATDNIPTCGIVICTVNEDITWDQITEKHMVLDKILTPKNPIL